jgi:hypothetical protein
VRQQVVREIVKGVHTAAMLPQNHPAVARRSDTDWHSFN